MCIYLKESGTFSAISLLISWGTGDIEYNKQKWSEEIPNAHWVSEDNQICPLPHKAFTNSASEKQQMVFPFWSSFLVNCPV